MRKRLVAGNWKMHGSRQHNASLIAELIAGLEKGTAADVLICPPYPYLHEIGRALDGHGIWLGAQDACAEDEGAFTGEVAAAMLRDVGCSHAIVGHSERRALFNEDDRLIARKFVAIQRAGLTPVLCIGETFDEREQGMTSRIVERQLGAVLDVAGPGAFAASVVAYEPVWAIGTGRTASPQQAQEVHAHIRGIIAARDAKIADSLRLLYGGSVKAANAAELFAMPDVDGGLVGGASLQADEFLGIIEAAA
ncbi:MAG TPA: triose-phosphate isomerase [Gammaproteobacteria bacterium]|nr:triose-phosphate isomerase [Gammaproteobacteria bacterium]